MNVSFKSKIENIITDRPRESFSEKKLDYTNIIATDLLKKINCGKNCNQASAIFIATRLFQTKQKTVLKINFLRKFGITQL